MLRKMLLSGLAVMLALPMGCGVEPAESQAPGNESESAALPLKDHDGSPAPASGGSEMDCYIDTPAYDQYTPHYCARLGTTASTASFRLRPATPACGYVWYDHPECTTAVCTVPILPGQTISLGAYYFACQGGIPTQGAGAAAEYEYGW